MKKLVLATTATLLTAGAAFSAAPRTNAPAAPRAEAAALVLATGPSSAEEGYLEIEVDEYGSWGDYGGVGLSDAFNPLGPETERAVAFTAGYLLFVPDRGQREVLTTIPDWLDLVLDDPATTSTITSGNVGSDLNGDGVVDTATSSFTVTGGGTDLAVELTQTVRSLGVGVAEIVQTYSITNHEPVAVGIQLVRTFDGDILYDGDFVNDEVGTTSNGNNLGPYVFMQDPGDRSTAVTLSGAGSAYYGGKLGILPGGLPPAYDFGTDTEVYDAFGLPPNWANHIAGVGYDTDGVSGPQPLGCDVGVGCDAFVGMSFDLTLEGGSTEEVIMIHTYGSNLPGGGEVRPALDFSGTCPGPMTVTISGLTPNGVVAVGIGSDTSGTVLPEGPCAGQSIELSDIATRQEIEADATGTATLPAMPADASCGAFVQAVDLSSCVASPVEAVP